MCVVTILRGLPGAGKSTRAEAAKVKLPNTVICSIDSFFMNNGEYKFQPDLLRQAYSRCLTGFVQALNDRAPNIIVDYTNVTVAEIAPYYALAEACRARAEVVTLKCTVETAILRNIHGATLASIIKMNKQLEEEEDHFPWWWNRSWEMAK